MNYYSHNIGDYAQATMHLSLVEDAIYTRLLRRYYAEESPIVNDMQKVCRWVGARSEEERQAVEDVLSEFFDLQEGYWHNKRADAEISAYHAKSSKASESAAKRWNQTNSKPAMPSESERKANAMPTHCEGNANQEPITNNQETDKEKTSKKNPAAQAASLSVPDLTRKGVNEQVATEFLAIRKRKRAPLTAIAMEGLMRESAQAGMSLNEALRTCVERGWQGFNAEWVQPKPQAPQRQADRLADWNAKMSEVINRSLGKPEMIDMGVIDASE